MEQITKDNQEMKQEMTELTKRVGAIEGKSEQTDLWAVKRGPPSGDASGAGGSVPWAAWRSASSGSSASPPQLEGSEERGQRTAVVGGLLPAQQANPDRGGFTKSRAESFLGWGGDDVRLQA